MIRIGLTGSLGAGKSAVGKLFQEWGAWRIDADELARRAVEVGRPAHQAIRRAFGPAVFTADGTLDRSALRRIVFQDPEARRRLERIVHPEVRRLRTEELARAREGGARVVVEEVPLLFEAELEEEYDAVVVVDAPHDLRRKRLRSARELAPEEFEAMDAAQQSAEEKRARADHVILNDGSRDALRRRAGQVWSALVGTAPAP